MLRSIIFAGLLVFLTPGCGSSDNSQSSSGGSTTGGTTTDTTPPTVASTTPANAATGAAINTTVSVTFSEGMNTSTLTAPTTTTCGTATLQVSTNNFTNCIAMSSATPAASGGNTIFTMTPATNLANATTYQIRVTTGAKDAAGNALAAQFTTATGFSTIFTHTITIDGTNDFTANETFVSSTTGYTTYVTWDATYVYIGYTGADVSSGASNAASRWVVAYIGATSGTNTGITYNTQTPGMPTGFNAKYQLRFKGDGSYTNTQVYTSSWGDAAWDFTGDVFRTGTYVEFRLPRVDIGSPTTLKVAVNMLFEFGGSESSYGVTPSTSFTDGYNPSYAKYLSCNLNSSAMPTTACTILP